MRTFESRAQVQMKFDSYPVDIALKQLDLDGFAKAPAWLAGVSASVALVRCLGSGPWKVQRRKTVQEQLLHALKRVDEAGVPYHTDITFADIEDFSCPLAWQRAYLEKAQRYADSKKRQFDSLFNKPVMAASTLRQHFVECFGPVDSVPKVLAMFARDYLLFDDVFPVDRHVRRWLSRCGLPTTAAKAIPRLREHGIHNTSALSRAIFALHSVNPSS